MSPANFFFLDLSKFDESTGGYPEIKQEISEAFIRKTPGILMELELAARSGDAMVTGFVLHKLKSSVGVFCIDALYNEMANIEENPQLTPAGLTRINKVITDVNTLIIEIQKTF